MKLQETEPYETANSHPLLVHKDGNFIWFSSTVLLLSFNNFRHSQHLSLFYATAPSSCKETPPRMWANGLMGLKAYLYNAIIQKCGEILGRGRAKLIEKTANEHQFHRI